MLFLKYTNFPRIGAQFRLLFTYLSHQINKLFNFSVCMQTLQTLHFESMEIPSQVEEIKSQSSTLVSRSFGLMKSFKLPWQMLQLLSFMLIKTSNSVKAHLLGERKISIPRIKQGTTEFILTEDLNSYLCEIQIINVY